MVGFDTRLGAQRMALTVGKTLAARGIRVVVSDRACPTPALSLAVARDPECVGGVMITASEAPREYGGLLVRQHDGGHVSQAFASLVDRLIAPTPTTARGEVERSDFVTGYLDELWREADVELLSRAHLRVVVDPMYGANVGIASTLLERVGCEVISIHDEIRPDFRGLHPDPTEPWVDDCEQAVVQYGADLGLVFGGGGERLGIVDGSGRLLSRHNIAPLVLEYLTCFRGLTGRVVTTLDCSLRTVLRAEQLGCEVVTTPVGFTPLCEEIRSGGALLAADARGSVAPGYGVPGADALWAALMCLGLAGELGDARLLSGRVEQEVGDLRYGQRDLRMDEASVQRLRILLPGMNPASVVGLEPEAVSHCDGLRVALPGPAWLLVRPSRAFSIVRASAEAPTEALLSKLLAEAPVLCTAQP
jgi:phosphomannomutase